MSFHCVDPGVERHDRNAGGLRPATAGAIASGLARVTAMPATLLSMRGLNEVGLVGASGSAE